MSGFVCIPNEFFDMKLTSMEFHVQCYLLKCRNSVTGKCFPSYKTIANDCNLSRSSVIRAVKSLNEKGIISVKNCFKNHLQKSNFYEITQGLYDNRTGVCS